MDMSHEPDESEADSQEIDAEPEHTVSSASPTASPQPTRLRLPASVIQNAIFAGLIAVLMALLARFILDIGTPAEIFGDRLTRFIPLAIFSQLLNLFGTTTKHLYFGGLLLGEAVTTTLAGILYWWLRAWVFAKAPRIAHILAPQDEPDFREVPIIALFLWLVSAGIAAPVLGGGLLGAAMIGGWTNVLTAQVAPNIAFAIAFTILQRRSATTAAVAPTPAQLALARRRLFQQIGFGALVIAGGALTWDFITNGAASLFGFGGQNQAPLQLGSVPSRIVPPPTPTYGPWTAVSGQTPEVTSALDFYYVSKNLAADPGIDAGSWQLKITGLVKQPYNLSYSDLHNLPQIQRYHTLECISNEVGGNLISNALFTGVSLADVIQRAGIKTGGSELIFHAADGYSDSLHMAQALDPRSLIVYQINGGALPQPHGYPARLLIPGLYGMKNGKWLTSLEVGSGGYTGYWEERGWTREAHVKTMARIDTPHDSDLLVAKPTYIAGIAFASDRGISEVDVTTDGGRTWQPANLRRPLGNLTWVLWEYLWTPPSSGTFVIATRAIDGQGYVQQPTEAPPLPDGSSGYQAISVTVR